MILINLSIRLLLFLMNIFGLRCDVTQLVPEQLNFLQKQHRDQVSLDMLDRANSYFTCMVCNLTAGELWIYNYGIQTSQQFQKGQNKNIKRNSSPYRKAPMIRRMEQVCVLPNEAYFESDKLNMNELLKILRSMYFLEIMNLNDKQEFKS